MKRWMVRLAALSTVALVGLILFAHALPKQNVEEKPKGVLESAEVSEPALQPIPLEAGVAEDGGNPFRKQSLRVSQEPELPSRYAMAPEQQPAAYQEEPSYRAQPNYNEQANYREQPSYREQPAAATDEPARLNVPQDAAEIPKPQNPFRGAAQGTQADPSYADSQVEPAVSSESVSPERSHEASASAGEPAEALEAGPSAALTDDATDASTDPKAIPAYGAPYNAESSSNLATSDSRTAYAARSGLGEVSATPGMENAFAPPANNAARSAMLSGGRPGDRKLEGNQSPSLAIEKTAPTEVQVNKPATFLVRVRNVGQVVANEVEVHDQVPHGTELVSTKPNARDDAGKLVWELGTMKPGDERTLEMQVLPTTEGDIGSVASVTFRADASVRARVTRPQLKLEATVPSKVLIGDTAKLKILVSNPGTGAATGVFLTEKIPPGLKHEGGSELEFEVGTLVPGESRELELALAAAQPGTVTNVLSARGDADLSVEERDDIEVIAPAMKLSIDGPKRRFLQRNATYNLSVTNPGTAVAKNLELLVTLPRGLQFVDANNEGHYDATAHTVVWSLVELPPGETGTVTMSTLAVEAGDLKLQVAGKAAMGLSDSLEEDISVEGVSAIFFELVDVNDPIEVGGETSYEIRVINQGSAAATNVRLAALLPPELKPLDASGPVQHTIEQGRVLFEPLSQLAPKADTTYTVKVQGKAPGDLRLRVQIVTDQITSPVTKEESTQVYADE